MSAGVEHLAQIGMPWAKFNGPWLSFRNWVTTSRPTWSSQLPNGQDKTWQIKQTLKTVNGPPARSPLVSWTATVHRAHYLVPYLAT